MIIVLTFLSLIFIAIGFIINVKNANYLLAGYNTMSEKEKQNIDIQSYVKYFRKFHLFLGVSIFIIGILINFYNPDLSLVIVILYIVSAYLFLAWKSNQFLISKNKKQINKNRISIIVLAIVLVGLATMFTYDLRDNPMIFEKNYLKIEGSYGMEINYNEIKTIKLVNELPQISIKTNGFALKNVQKGYFKTKSGEKVKLYINSTQKPFIYITTQNGQKIYYSSKDKSNLDIFELLQKKIKNH